MKSNLPRLYNPLIIDVGCGWLKYPATLEEPKLRFEFDDSLMVMAVSENVVGVDLCRYNNDMRASNLHFPFKDNTADVVTARQILEHVDTQSFIREVWRVLKPYGRLLIETPNSLFIFRVLRALRNTEANPHLEHIQTFSAGELRNLLRRNGFNAVQISYYNVGVSGSNILAAFTKKIIAFICDHCFPMFDRDIRVVAEKDGERRFEEYV